MDHSVDDDSEDMQSETFGYDMPLSGSSPSPVAGRSADSDESFAQDSDRTRSNDTSVSHRGMERDRKSPHIRNIHQMDAITPRFHNKGGGGRFAHLGDSGNGASGLPPIPFQERSEPSTSQGNNSLSSFLAKDAGSVSFNADPDTNDSVSEPSLSLQSLGVQLTPTSNAASSYSRRIADPTRRSAHQIGMDGTIQSLPLSPGEETRDSNPSTMHSQAGASHTGHSPNRTAKDKRKYYFTAAQEMRDTFGSGSLHSVVSGAEQCPRQRLRDYDMDDDYDVVDPVTVCGYVCPVWFTSLARSTPSLNRISLCLVNILPCFWCCGSMARGSSTDRTVLTRLNVLCLFMAFVQLVAAFWLASLLLIVDDGPGALGGFAPHFWNLNGATFSIGILAFVLILTCSCTIRVIKEVDLVGAIRYLWVLLWLFPFKIFFMISLYDYHNVTKVWIHHWWLEDQMSWFRMYFCEDGTVSTKCLVPILGGPEFDSEDDWCLENYQATDCSDIRDSAQLDMERKIRTFYYGLGGWSSALFVLMVLMVNSLERIITKPIVQKSRETNVPAWLSLPTFTNALVGAILLYSPSSLLSSSSGKWISIVYFVASALFLVALLTGWFLSAYTIRNHADKRTKNIAVIIMITVMAANIILLATIFGASLLFSADLINAPIDESQRGEIACGLDQEPTCTRCDAVIPRNRCPEWTLEEVTTILQTQLKQSATLASIFFLYAIGVLRFAVTLLKHLSLYQIDYV